MGGGGIKLNGGDLQNLKKINNGGNDYSVHESTQPTLRNRK